jgi:hypothetical protein
MHTHNNKLYQAKIPFYKSLALPCHMWHNILYIARNIIVKVKEIVWVGQSKKALVELPAEMQKTIGYGLYIAQCGDMPKDAKVLKGFSSAGVLEVQTRYQNTATRY